MLDYDLQRCTRRCAATDRELSIGEECYSVLVPDGAAVKRLDYAREAWQVPPENAIGWWKTTIVDPHAGRLHWAPNDVMLSYFERLLHDPTAEDARYCLALLLVRRRVLRVEGQERDPAGNTMLILHCSRNDATYRIPEKMPTPDRAAQIQDQLSVLLDTNGINPAQTQIPQPT